MMYRSVVVAVVVIAISLAGCSNDACPVTVKSDYYFKKKVKMRYSKSKGKPTPSLIHVTRVNYKPGSGK